MKVEELPQNLLKVLQMTSIFISAQIPFSLLRLVGGFDSSTASWTQNVSVSGGSFTEVHGNQTNIQNIYHQGLFTSCSQASLSLIEHLVQERATATRGYLRRLALSLQLMTVRKWQVKLQSASKVLVASSLRRSTNGGPAAQFPSSSSTALLV